MTDTPSTPSDAMANAPVTDVTLTAMKEGLDTRATTITTRINQLTTEREKVNRNLAAQRAQVQADADKRRREINAEVATLREELATIDRVRSGFERRTRTKNER